MARHAQRLTLVSNVACLVVTLIQQEVHVSVALLVIIVERKHMLNQVKHCADWVHISAMIRFRRLKCTNGLCFPANVGNHHLTSLTYVVPEAALRS